MDPETAGRSKTSEVAPQERLQPVRLASAPPIRVLVAGADGFLGSHLLPRLESRGHLVRATFQDSDGPGRRAAPGVDWREVDLTHADQVEGLAEECDVIVHLAGLFSRSGEQTLAQVHGTGTRHLLADGARAGIARFVYVSVLGARPGGGEYFCTKFDAESAVVASSLPSIVLRPSVIYGPGDQFTAMIVRLLKKLPAFPMLGGGSFRVQPLAVEDMTDALIQCVERKDLDGRQFELAGPERLMFREIVGFVSDAIGVHRPGLHVPRQLASVAAICARWLDLPAPFVLEQLEILTTGSVLSTVENPLLSVFFVKPLPFRDAVADYLENQE
ncbi:MAG: NAD-dependent epimerase/dehydratase family protein [Gemmatimonadales bacterium]|nr:MAG: NAD-dependent epimerase/dehydratase family protein [Gemmatimonadales bacterium]